MFLYKSESQGSNKMRDADSGTCRPVSCSQLLPSGTSGTSRPQTDHPFLGLRPKLNHIRLYSKRTGSEGAVLGKCQRQNQTKVITRTRLNRVYTAKLIITVLLIYKESKLSVDSHILLDRLHKSGEISCEKLTYSFFLCF